ncbi:unnamed protein product [Protopolystoma xenopodis]|uniref:Uncharacterized protein n=1 Tax=Protopolystoma xenopodis TaxID=117903 RepID=A0A448XHG3_9PLAT|nr:unnamed protein product [Protopolystoma xenopodis]
MVTTQVQQGLNAPLMDLPASDDYQNDIPFKLTSVLPAELPANDEAQVMWRSGQCVSPEPEREPFPSSSQPKCLPEVDEEIQLKDEMC